MASGDLYREDGPGSEGAGLLVEVEVLGDLVKLNFIFIQLLPVVLDIDSVMSVLHPRAWSLGNNAHLRILNLGGVRLDRFQGSGRGRLQRQPPALQVGGRVLLPRAQREDVLLLRILLVIRC